MQKHEQKRNLIKSLLEVGTNHQELISSLQTWTSFVTFQVNDDCKEKEKEEEYQNATPNKSQDNISLFLIGD
ncbi:hypothetical protein Bca101_065512 [Brassica carinata]